MLDAGNVTVSGGIRKFVNDLPGLGASTANDLGQYVSVATADTTTYTGSDYYEIGLHEANGFQALASAGLFPNPPAARP